ncbi:MAG: MerC domain-containing protein [Bacteroidota bacterium]|nr:MerC domain-containing protein [Candidatus Kapabacteria bacterium]MDW8272580.1 MerC domain-containing protein [Bacteroidota bacterium]
MNSLHEHSPSQKWYDKKWLVTLLLILFFPIGLYALWKSTIISKKWKIAISAAFGLAIVLSLFVPSPPVPQRQSVTTPSNIPNIKERLQAELEGIKKFKGSEFYNSIDALKIELAALAAWAILINAGENAVDSNTRNLARKLKEKVIELQLKEFPTMRKHYARLINQNPKVHSLEATCYGEANEIIELRSNMFRSSDFVNTLHTQIKELLTMFRFKEVRYKQSKASTRYISFTLNAQPDFELVILQN